MNYQKRASLLSHYFFRAPILNVKRDAVVGFDQNQIVGLLSDRPTHYILLKKIKYESLRDLSDAVRHSFLSNKFDITLAGLEGMIHNNTIEISSRKLPLLTITRLDLEVPHIIFSPFIDTRIFYQYLVNRGYSIPQITDGIDLIKVGLAKDLEEWNQKRLLPT